MSTFVAREGGVTIFATGNTMWLHYVEYRAR